MGMLYKGNGLTLSHSLQTNPDEADFVLHVHDTYEILCCVSGNVKYLVEGREYSMPHGCLMLMRPAETHKLVVRGRGAYERYVLNFKVDELREFGIGEELITPFTDRALGEKNQYLASEFSGIEPAGLFHQMRAECQLLDPRQAVLANLYALMFAINTAFRTKDNRDNVSADNDIGRELIEYINRNLTEEMSLESVSEHVHMSPSQVNRVFRRLTGTSVYDYVLSKRLVMVQELIANGEGAVSASQRCGFRDYSAFYRFYKKRTGSAPSEAKRR